MRTVMQGLAVLAIGALTLLAGLYLFQGRLLYPAPAAAWIPAPPPFAEAVTLEQGGAWLLPANGTQATPSPVLIFAHGNGEAALHWARGFDAVRERGIAVLLVEYPGYGDVPGSPTLASIRATMLHAFDWVSSRADLDASRVVAYGRSIGGGAASLLAAERPVAALVLESSFTTLASLVREKGLPSFLLRDRYDNAAIVASLQKPVLVYHGTRDQIIGYQHALALARLGPHVTLESAACGHNDCPRPWPILLSFLKARAGIGATAP